MAQVQCPNCDGFKVHEEKQVIATERRQIPLSVGEALQGSLIVACIVGCVSLALILGLTSVEIGGFARVVIGVGLVLLALPFIVLAPIRAAQGKATIARDVPSLVKYDFHCQICGYSWTWRTDEPPPVVNVRPDLIAKGAKKLKDDERRRQEQQEQAAALWYLQQQQKK